MIKEIQARTLLASIPHPDGLFGARYNMNLYRGCQHQCIYCDSRSECYQIENFNQDVLVKANALELLDKELSSKRIIGTISTGSMNDPYMPLEARYDLTGRALELIAAHGFGVHVITKSSLVLRDVARLQRIARVYAAITLTITTADDDLARRIEPGAPVSSERLRAIRTLAQAGLYTGVTLMPVLPFIEDNEQNIKAIVERAADAGARYILPGFGVTLRDRQRRYYYAKLDQLFPGLRPQYERRFGERYSCEANDAKHLWQVFSECCERYGIATRMQFLAPRPRGPRRTSAQMNLFEEEELTTDEHG
jgi:DNA repair photolyase